MTRFEYDITTVLVIGCAFVIAHVIAAMLSQKVHPIALLGAIYLAVAPFSVAQELAFSTVLKYARMYSIGLSVVLAILVYRLIRFRSSALLLLAFFSFYVLAAAWSDVPSQAAKYKMQSLLTALAGVFIAYSAKTPDDLRKALRILLPGAMVFTILIWIKFIQDPAALRYMGRLYAFGINANRIGQSAAPLFILCAHVALYDPLKKWKMLAYMTGVLLGIIIISCGSRGAAGEALIGTFIVAMPLARRPALLITIFLIIAVTGVAVQEYVSTPAAERLASVDVSETNRDKPWGFAMEYFRESPLYGQGWVYTTNKRQMGATANMHSIYMQTLAETGIIGLALLLTAGFVVGIRYMMVYFANRKYSGGDPLVYYGAAITAAVLAHGVIEFGTISGTAVNSILIGFGFGMLDRFREWGTYHVQLTASHRTHVPYTEGSPPATAHSMRSN